MMTVWTMAASGLPEFEAFGPINLKQTLTISRNPESGRVRATLKHHATSVLGIVPLPLLLLRSNCVLDFQEGEQAYDLHVHVTMLSLPMLTYSGMLRCERDWRNLLSAEEKQKLGPDSSTP